MPDSTPLPASTAPPHPSETPRRALEQAARAAAEEQRLRTLLQNAPTCMASLAGPDHLVAITNELLRQLFGERPLTGLPLREALPELVGQPFFDLLDEAYRTGEPCYGREAGANADSTHAGQNRPVYFNFIGQPVRDTLGRVTGVLLFVYNVSAHVQARQLAEADDRPPATAHQLAIANEELAIANEELSVSYEELDASNHHLAATNLELATANEHLRTSNLNIQQQAQELHRAHLALRKLNQQLEARVAERTDQLQAALHDVEHANTALNLSNQQLTRTNQDLDSFVYASSHDLKQPVNNLAGLIEELHRSVTFADPAEEQLLLPLIHDALRQLSTNIDDLAALGQAQQVALAPAEPVDLKALVQDVLQTLEPQVRAARARVTTDFSVRPILFYSRASLRTILLNLLSNAFKYADPARPSRVHCSLWLEAGRPVLWVKDNGLGFDAARYGAELFQLFRRFHTHTEGTGVGLYLVNRLVQVQGGHLAVESQVGEGATFRVHFGRA
ncbi:PAS domain-containing sensor histidine kinase [Hymenobacter terricola]|uniref:PAS domain-containing sensor histidine kinase n=1 Tax=Hymenobacter terricola TaxID=2819236 RepID=UPI001B30A7C3|nr:PAS domain-containing sensor histidine kinase [Hymenobacter terricola]